MCSDTVHRRNTPTGYGDRDAQWKWGPSRKARHNHHERMLVPICQVLPQSRRPHSWVDDSTELTKKLMFIMAARSALNVHNHDRNIAQKCQNSRAMRSCGDDRIAADSRDMRTGAGLKETEFSSRDVLFVFMGGVLSFSKVWTQKLCQKVVVVKLKHASMRRKHVYVYSMCYSLRRII